MTAILCFGSSVVYGVGSTTGGWSDLLKQSIHSNLYGPNGVGELHEVYNLGIPGNTSEDLALRLESELKGRRRDMQPELLCIFGIGVNDCRAVDTPSNYISSPEEYQNRMRKLFKICSTHKAQAIAIGFTPVDETLTNPKLQPRTGKKSFFTNARIELFEEALKEVCLSEKIGFVPLYAEALQHGWTECLHLDGLHPNDKGHAWIADRVYSSVRTII